MRATAKISVHIESYSHAWIFLSIPAELYWIPEVKLATS